MVSVSRRTTINPRPRQRFHASQTVFFFIAAPARKFSCGAAARQDGGELEPAHGLLAKVTSAAAARTAGRICSGAANNPAPRTSEVLWEVLHQVSGDLALRTVSGAR
jgi:hypothetical protein